jgi:hypothetical protein
MAIRSSTAPRCPFLTVLFKTCTICQLTLLATSKFSVFPSPYCALWRTLSYT